MENSKSYKKIYEALLAMYLQEYLILTGKSDPDDEWSQCKKRKCLNKKVYGKHTHIVGKRWKSKNDVCPLCQASEAIKLVGK